MSPKSPSRIDSSPATAGDSPDPRQEIVDYFRLHPAAADSLEGIVNWWLPQQRYETAKAIIQQALDDLVKQGVVEEVASGDASLYRLSRKPHH